MISVCVTNLGKYNEGVLTGEWVELPATSSTIQSALDSIGIDNRMYEEYFFADYETKVGGVYDLLGEYSSFRELNALALALDDLDSGEIEKLEAIIDSEGCTSAIECLNLIHNLDSFYVRSDITSESEYGESIIEEGCIGEIPDNLINYLDHEAIGRDWLLCSSSATIGKYGLIEKTDSIDFEYSKYDDLPTQQDIDDVLGEDTVIIQEAESKIQEFDFDR